MSLSSADFISISGFSGSVQLLGTVMRGAYESFCQPIENIGRYVMNKMDWKQPDAWIARPPGPARLKAFITGATQGIGLSTASMLAGDGAHVILGVRDRERGKRAMAEILLKAGRGASVEMIDLDLSSLASVRSCVEELYRRKTLSNLDLVILNAGISPDAERRESCDGVELCLQANWLSHWLLAHGLLRGVKKDRHQGQKPSTRFVWLSSVAHYSGSIKLRDLQSKDSYSPFLAYALSKLLCTLSSIEMQRRFDRQPELWSGCSSISVHPGIVDTQLAHHFLTNSSASWLGSSDLSKPIREAFAAVVNASRSVVMRSCTQGAETILFAALAPDRMIKSGYIMPPRKTSEPHLAAKDERNAIDVWESAQKLTGLDTDSIYLP